MHGWDLYCPGNSSIQWCTCKQYFDEYSKYGDVDQCQAALIRQGWTPPQAQKTKNNAADKNQTANNSGNINNTAYNYGRATLNQSKTNESAPSGFGYKKLCTNGRCFCKLWPIGNATYDTFEQCAKASGESLPTDQSKKMPVSPLYVQPYKK